MPSVVAACNATKTSAAPTRALPMCTCPSPLPKLGRPSAFASEPSSTRDDGWRPEDQCELEPRRCAVLCGGHENDNDDRHHRGQGGCRARTNPSGDTAREHERRSAEDQVYCHEPVTGRHDLGEG